MDKENLDKINIFTEKLKNRYVESRKLLEGLTEEQVLNDNHYKNCFKIASVLFTTANASKVGFETYFALASDVDFDVDNFLDLFEVKIEKNDNGEFVPQMYPKDESTENNTDKQ